MNIHPELPRIRQTISDIGAFLGERLTTSQAVRDQHGKDQTWAAGASPDAVAFVHSTEEVARIVSICARDRVPLIAHGAGTSLEGHITAPYGGVSLNMTGLNRILEVNAEDLDCRVEAGVTRKTLNAHLRDQGLFFPIDPGADATLGGMAATRASGTNAVRYGTMRENVLGLTVVMANGEVIRTGTRARKSSAGYDLTRLMVGSEGTLGIITEAQLKLYGIPEAMTAGVCTFPTIDACCKATIETIQLGIPVARIELVDEAHIAAINAYSKLSLRVAPTLFLEFHGSAAHAREQIETFLTIADGHGVTSFEWAEKEEDRQKLWQARHDVFWSTKGLGGPTRQTFSTDLCVPISRLAECVTETNADLQSHGLLGPTVGHVGDGNFHVGLYANPNDASEVAQVKAAYDRMVARALAMGGTCTGEHGIGSGKIKYLEMEHGPAIKVMRSIKQALDPDNILNPGKIFRL